MRKYHGGRKHRKIKRVTFRRQTLRKDSLFKRG